MSNKLRGQDRRDFIKSAFAMGAALGWGPSRIMDFIARGGGDALAADCAKPVQNLVVFVGVRGAHGYPHLLWPHADSMASPDRFNDSLAVHFMQMAAAGGTASALGGALKKPGTNYVNPPALATSGWGSWAAGERYKKITGVGNQAFRGFMSQNVSSRALDRSFYGVSGSDPTPSNVVNGARRDPKENFMVVTRETPWGKWGEKKYITAIDGGAINPFHIAGAHNHWINFNKRWTMMAAAATIQQARPTITPVIMVGEMESPFGGDSSAFYGTLPGAPAPATVSSAAAMIDLFNSNAAKAGGLFSGGKNATVFEAYTKGFIGSSKSATAPTFTKGYRTAKLGANLVGLNLSEKLLPNATDQERYGLTGNVPVKAADLRDRMIVAAKALALGLTSQVVIKYFDDDPHDLFTSGGAGGINASTAAAIFGNYLEAFMDDLMTTPDPFCPSMKLGDNTVIVFVGDTPRTMILRNNWNDPTVGGQNRTWIMSNGVLRSGFFGGDRATAPGAGTATNDHTAAGPGEGGLFDPRTGDLRPFDLSGGTGRIGGVDMRRQYGEIAMASVLYAVSRGDIRRVNDFYTGVEFPAIQVPVIL